MRLTERQRRDREQFQEFVAKRITPHADRWDAEERLPTELVAELADQGYLGALVPASYGGTNLDAITFGLLNEALGYGCSSTRSLLTVHSMVAHAVTRWGSVAQKVHWLPLLATGAAVGAFALTEPGAGSDAAGLATTARPTADGYVLDGTKRWITYGQRADVFLLFARCADRLTAFLVERDTPGLSVVPVGGLLGTRASMVAELRLSGCVVPADAVVGRPGFGLAAVATSALDIGRYSVAWGCVGLLAACLDAALDHAEDRVQFGKPLREHQLVQRLLADMATLLRAARLLCLEAGELKDAGHPETVPTTWMAKYFAARGAFTSAADTVQIFGAAGCGPGHPAQRLLRDAKIMEIIEGSTELQQIHIGQSAYQNRGRPWPPAGP
jgi:glutaryl-CoA dehydrogenase (non-decarboxylating)